MLEIPNSQRSITNPIVSIDGDRAVAECQWYVPHRIQVDDVRFVEQRCDGRYLDTYEQQLPGRDEDFRPIEPNRRGTVR